MTLDWLIIGGGITGVSLARLLQLRGQANVLVLEAEPEPGGLCRSREIGAHTVDVGGGHFLCSRFREVYDFVFSHVPQSAFNRFDRISKVRLSGHDIDYPVESNLWQLPTEVQVDYLLSVAQAREALGQPAPQDFGAWIRWKLGDRIADEYMLPYNRKLWGVKAEEMDTDWLDKIPRLDPREILRGNLARQSDRSKFPSHDAFYYPKSGGFQAIFDAIHAPVAHCVRLGERVTRMTEEAWGWTVNDHRARRVVNTAPWPTLFDALGRPPEIEDDIGRLRASSLVVSLWSRQYDHDWHWRYLPSLDIPEHREFYIHNFAPGSAPDGVYTETERSRVPGGPGGPGVRKGPGGPLHEHVNDFAYPVPTIGHASAIARVLAFFEPKNLFGVGRWGTWRYSNSDVCIREAMTFVETHE